MKMFAHIFKTWAIAQLMHPLLFLVYVAIRGAKEVEIWVAGVFFIFFFSVFASIPSLLIAWLLFYVLSNTDLTQGEKLIGWFVSVIAAILINFILLSVAFDGIINDDMINIVPPALTAAIISILFRLRSFVHFQSNYKIDS